ncbi:TrkH family potassium uptake protein [Candidatus Chromulinivorax destructor]|uniref:Potassium transporter n=1 Tax=Candidatus Chromulinivorax destructor TaxID=2066483 RepID=A0A345ZCX7_9BACT|nr:potassium transporter TrkG [Candidatus Chromulinivorax destructor]AXK61144.1 hypothetical protein C0J27_05435 [Candidatus Chromulinivorax destructor]
MAVKRTKQFIKNYPAHSVLLSLFVTICVGFILLALPVCQTKSIGLLDLFFTSASLTTVTGMMTVSLQDFTIYGHCIMLILMQIGGLGLMTMSLFLMSLFVDLGLYTQILASEILSIQSFKDTKRILLFIIKLTFACEFIGAIITFFIIRHDYTLKRAIFLSIFHAISSFCNVGLSLFAHDSISYNNNILMCMTTTLLLLFGSLGFVTWHEFLKYCKQWNRHPRLSWNTIIVVKTFFLTMAVTTILFWLLERNNTLSSMSALQTLCNMLLVGVGTKSSGFLPVDINYLQPATILLLAATAFIGAAPSSTGGGIKTGAFAIFLAVIRATIYGTSHIDMKGRSIARDQVYKALSIISLASSWIIVVSFCLLITEHTYGFMDIFLETISAFANNGISTGLTKWLTPVGKLFMIATMIVGRIGALTLIIGMRSSSDTKNYSYPEERVILG